MIAQANLHEATDYTPYEGKKITGWPEMTLLRDELVWENGELAGAAGKGRFLRCDISATARPRRVTRFDAVAGGLAEKNLAPRFRLDTPRLGAGKYRIDSRAATAADEMAMDGQCSKCGAQPLMNRRKVSAS
jgi:hypothetical protein